jgi:hypothetical protein
MIEDQEPQSGRARERAEANARKKAKLAWSQGSFDLLASRYVHLQVARLTKALRFADAALERGDLKAVKALVSVVAAMDRYHVLGNQASDHASSSHPDALGLQSPAAPALPPLRLSHTVSAAEEAQAESEEVTVFGA